MAAGKHGGAGSPGTPLNRRALSRFRRTIVAGATTVLAAMNFPPDAHAAIRPPKPRQAAPRESSDDRNETAKRSTESVNDTKSATVTGPVLLACCDPVTGTCSEAESECPEGLNSLGVGTDCDPNCCEQPVATAGDNCTDVFVHEVSVPPDGAPPVVLTITGDNTEATHDDYPDLCDMEIFNPDALGASDPGWWEAFAIDECAFVVLDTCCSNPRINWVFLATGCPCDGTIVPTIPSGCPECFGELGPFCDDSSERMMFGPLPAGTYYYPVYSGASGQPGPYQLHIAVRACPHAACCLEDQCTVTNEFECAEVGGYWVGTDPLPRGYCLGGENFLEECDFDIECPESYCVPPDPVDPCQEEPDGFSETCSIGSCCTGPATCVNYWDVFDPVTKPSCDAAGGTYVGGASCDSSKSPCRLCEIEGPGNCQLNDVLVFEADAPSDLAAPGGPMVRADDFVPLTDSISTVCVLGRYHDTTDPDGDGSNECVDTVTDDFRVTVYADAGGIPGNVIGSSLVDVTHRGIVPPPDFFPGCCPSCSSWGDLYSYNFELVDPIAGMTPGACHWLEVTNNTPSPEGDDPNRCTWHWSSGYPAGNSYSFSGSHDGVFGVYEDGGQRTLDLAFCLDTAIVPGGCDELQRACCNCPDADCPDAGACSVETFVDCSRKCGRGKWFFDALDCSEAPCPLTAPLGDDCESEAIPITGDVSVNFSTICATTDGPTSSPSDFGPATMLNDIWFRYTATCTGRLIASMCSTEGEYDSMISIFRDRNDPTICTCPGTSSDMQSGVASDEGCDGCGNGGAGFLERVTLSGWCWLIRVGGYGFDHGAGRLDVTCEERFCTESSPAQPEMIPDGFGNLVVSTKNRFLSFTAGDPGEDQAVKVTFVDLPPPYEAWNGTAMWVDLPMETSENGSSIEPVPGFANFKAAKLVCTAYPFFTDWNAEGIVHVYHEGIVPGGTYSIQVVHESCSIATPANFSQPLTMATARWGDTIKDLSIVPPGPPDGAVNIIDILAILGRFVSDSSSITKARADLEPATLDLLINIPDVVSCVNAFSGLPYPFQPGATPPCGG